MAIKRETYLYELLVRFGPNGYLGAHAIDHEHLTDGSEILATKELPARPIEKQADVSRVLGAEGVRLIEAADKAIAEKVAAETAQAHAEIAQAEAEKITAGLTEQLKNAGTEIHDLQDSLREANGKIESLEADAKATPE